MQMTWKAWLSGLLAAGITSVADAFVLHASAPEIFNAGDGFALTAKVLAYAAALKLAFWVVKHSPPGALPNGEGK